MSWEKGERLMLNEIGMMAFEDAIRRKIEEQRAQLNMTELALGKLAFPHVADPRRKVQSIRKGQGSGVNRKPQQLRGTDIFNLCEALHLPWKMTLEEAYREAEKMQEAHRRANIAEEKLRAKAQTEKYE